MHYTSKLQLELNRLIDDYAVPNKDYIKNIIQFENLDIASSSFEVFANNCALDTSPKQKSYADIHRAHYRQILLNLARASVSNKWVALDGDSNAYSNLKFQSFVGLSSFRRTSSILKELERSGLIYKEQGKKYKENPMVNLYLPSKDLAKQLIGFGLDTANDASFNGDYLSINEPEDDYINYGFKGTKDFYDLELINEFAKANQWACKSSICRRFKYNPYNSGRLTTAFQNLKSNDYKIRINTLINGNPIVEIDFNANHLRMLLAMYQYDVVGGDDAYFAIAESSGINRDKVKAFFTTAMNLSNLYTHKNVLQSFGLTHKEADAIYQAFERLYSRVGLYSNFGLLAMNLEGDILKRVMLQGVNDNVLALPIHDACAVEAHNRDWAVDVMLQAWSHVIGKSYEGAKTVVKY